MGKLDIQHSAILGRAKYMSKKIYIYIHACGTYMYIQNVSYCRLKGCVDLDAVKKPQETP